MCRRTAPQIVGVDDEWCQNIAVRLAQAGKHVVRISVRRKLSNGLFVEGERIMRAGAGGALPIAELGGIGSLRGLHNAQNAACATAAALALGLEPQAIQAGLRSFPGLPHRMEEVGRRGKVLFVNDSKATNADSAAQALACFGDIFWIAGGKPKTGGIESLRGFFPRIRKAYLIGEAAERICRDARVTTCRTKSTARSTKRWQPPRAMRKPRPRRSRSCCCRRPAPRSTSIAISRSAATRFGRWCGRCRA